MELILVIATLFGGGAAVWWFYEKIMGWLRPKPKPIIHLVEELKYNQRELDYIKYTTAPALRTETWDAALAQGVNISEDLRSKLASTYRKIQSAKKIHESIQSVPQGAITTPEQIKIEELLLEAKQDIATLLLTLSKCVVKEENEIRQVLE